MTLKARLASTSGSNVKSTTTTMPTTPSAPRCRSATRSTSCIRLFSFVAPTTPVGLTTARGSTTRVWHRLAARTSLHSTPGPPHSATMARSWQPVKRAGALRPDAPGTPQEHACLEAGRPAWPDVGGQPIAHGCSIGRGNDSCLVGAERMEHCRVTRPALHSEPYEDHG